MKFECHITVKNTDDKIMDLLSQVCELSRQQLNHAIKKGALWHTRNNHTQRIKRVKKTLKIDDELHFYYDKQVLDKQVAPAQLIADHSSYSIWYKPYGMLSQGSKWSDHTTISFYAQQYFNNERPVFIVHRLDRAASGLILVAHSKKAASALSHLFAGHHLEKEYQIISHGQLLNEQTVTLAINNKAATSHFSLMEYDADADLSQIKVRIESGRKHQIRIHASSIGLPVVGDRLHGKAMDYSQKLNLQLCSARVSFICPLTEQLVEVSLSKDLCPCMQLSKDLLSNIGSVIPNK